MGIIFRHANDPVPLLPPPLSHHQALLNMMLAKRPENRLENGGRGCHMAVVPEVIQSFFDRLRPPTPGSKRPASVCLNCYWTMPIASSRLHQPPGLPVSLSGPPALAQRMSRLAREELRHFEQVRSIMEEMGVTFDRLSASRYAGKLRDCVREHEPYKLLDMLLVGALIEARSCERFAKLAPHLPSQLGKFYAGLLASEARHFEHYLRFARTECDVSEPKSNARLEELKT